LELTINNQFNTVTFVPRVICVPRDHILYWSKFWSLSSTRGVASDVVADVMVDRHHSAAFFL